MSNLVDYEINKELGECYLFMGEYEKSRSYYEKAISCDGSQADPFLGLAAIALSEEKLDEALTYYTKANDLNSNDKSLTGMAMIQMELGKQDLAFELFSGALKMNPCNMICVNSLVKLGYVMGRLENVIPFLESAVEADSNEAVRYALAGCLKNVGRTKEAKQHLEVLLGANPANDHAQQLYAQIAA